MTSIQERIAILEEQARTVIHRLDHIDLCVDSLKRTVWTASGAVAIIVGLITLIAK